jgi:hypothetical protein
MSDGNSREFGMLEKLRVNLPTDIFQSLHVLLLSEDDARGKALAKALRDQRARVGDVQRATRDASGARGVDLVVVDSRANMASADQLAKLKNDVRARWASVIEVDFGRVVKGDGSVLLASLSELVAPLVEADRKLTERAQTELSFSTSLAPLGPSRTLRALSLSGHTLLVELQHPTLQASIEVANELLVSAAAQRGERRWDAWSALVRILGLEDAEVSVARRSFTAVMNIMEPVDQALEVAAQERLCEAAQIAVEEAEASARLKAPAFKAAAPVPATALPLTVRPSNVSSVPAGPTMPAPESASAKAPVHIPPAAPMPVIAPPYAPARPAAGLAPQRTLLGINTGLAAAGAGLAKPGVKAPPLPAPPPLLESPAARGAAPEAPRYAHRAGGGSAPKASMTLLGVAPGAIPGLAELRNKLAQPKPDPAPAELTNVTLQNKPANSDFDPPTVKHDVTELSGLSELDEEELLDDLGSSAEPLSVPLPPPRPLDGENEIEGGAFEDAEDPSEQTTITPSALTRELLEAVQDALDERPTSDALGARPIQADVEGVHSREPGPPSARSELELEDGGEADLPHEGGPEETLVVKRPPDKPRARKSSSRSVLGVGLLLGLGGLALFAAQREWTAREAAAPVVTVPARPPAAAMPTPAPAAPNAEAPTAAVAEAPAAVAANAPAPAAEPANAAPAAEPAKAAAPAAEPSASAEPAAAPTGAAGDAEADPDALLRKGQRLAAQGNTVEARAALEQALALAADNPHVRTALAETLLKAGDAEAALVQAQAAVKLRPKRGRYQVLVGDVLKRLGKLDQAQVAWKKALEIDPEDAEAKQRLGGAN